MAAPEPNTVLGRHRILSPNAAVRVSPLSLGSMNFGSEVNMVGICTKETAFEIMDAFHAAGGNFIDTANNYASGMSEQIVGEWMEERGVREQIVLATKFSSPYLLQEGHDKLIHSNFVGNSTKSLRHSVDSSLKKLRTSFIDILYIHWWDWTTSIPELMQSLNVLINQGKVLYLGASDLPAYVVSKANQYASDHGLRGFSLYQGRWSAANRDFERDIIHMARDEGMALVPWGALGSGMFKTAAQRKEMADRGEKGRDPLTRINDPEKIADALQKIADKKNGATVAQVAVAYLMHKAPYVFPVIGVRNVGQLNGMIDALKIEMTEDDIKDIDNAAPFDPGFPVGIFGDHPSNSFMLKRAGHNDYVQRSQPIRPYKS